jgi:putative intracellular protease/amidase
MASKKQTTLATPCKLLMVMCLSILTLYSTAQVKKVLIVSTNVDSVGASQSGTFLREIAYPFKYFTDQGYTVDIVTPKGGKAALYQRPKEADDLILIQNSDAFISKTSATLSPIQVNPKEYVAVFYPGGHGQYFDVVNDERIARLAAAIYERGGVVGTAGHGAASLINVQLRNGAYLVENKSMTCFPHWAEKKFMDISQYGKLLAFDMQEVLARRGAKLTVCTAETYGSKELNQIIDAKNRMVTGAFAGSAQWVAEQMVVLIKGKKTH